MALLDGLKNGERERERERERVWNSIYLRTDTVYKACDETL